MIILFRKKTLLLAAVVSLAVILSGGLLFSPARQTFAATGQGRGPVIVIDPGHGGEDGGAVSAAGAYESHINLSISHKLNDILEMLGFETVMTRTDDRAIYSDGAKTLREKKNSDLKNRVALTNAIDDALLVSIHQNSLPSSTAVHGAQVFYAPTDGSEQLAEEIQRLLNAAINDGNEKRKKPVDPSVYLMKNARCTAVLVECGFMSNPAEAERLQQEDHQERLALSIAAALLANRNAPKT